MLDVTSAVYVWVGALVGAEVQFKMNDKWALSADAACYQARAIPRRALLCAIRRNSAQFCATL